MVIESYDGDMFQSIALYECSLPRTIRLFELSISKLINKLLADGKLLIVSKLLVDTKLLYVDEHLVDTKHLASMKLCI